MLRSNHSLAKEHGGHAVHRVYYGKEGEPLEVGKLVMHMLCLAVMFHTSLLLESP